MPLLGAHVSTAGGLTKAVTRACGVGCDTFQIFVQQPRQWAVGGAKATATPVVNDEEAHRFRDAVQEAGLQKLCAHASYLINLASPQQELWTRSVEAFAVELARAEQLGLLGMVIHPGTAAGCDESTGLANVVRGLDAAIEQSKTEQIGIWLETTAGQGASLGHRFEQLAELLDRVARPNRYGVCLDTCHIFAAGYPLISRDEYAATMQEFDRTVGLERLYAMHLNDSKKPRGSRVDRHEHIGDGCLGWEPFRHLLNDTRFALLPMYLETPKGLRDGRELDSINLERLRGLMRRRRSARALQ
jgi:deoxyribonuclease-4